MKILSFVCLSFACLGVGMLAHNGANAQPATDELPAGIVAKVGPHAITAEDVLARINEFERHRPKDEQYLRAAYKYLVELKLLQCEADALDIAVSEEDRKAVTRRTIDTLKKQVDERYGKNLLPWHQWCSEQGYTEKEFEDYIYARSEAIVLKNRVVHFFDRTTERVSYIEIRLTSEETASRVLAQIDAGGDFASIALRNTADVDNAGVQVAYRRMGLPGPVEKPLFDELQTGAHTGIVKVREGDYRILLLKTRSPGQKKSYAELKDDIDAAGDVNEKQFESWVAVMHFSNKYPAKLRIPGQPPPKKTGE